MACLRGPVPAARTPVPPAPVPNANADTEADAHRRNTEWYKRRHPDGGMRQKAVEEKVRLAPSINATSGQWSAIGPQPIQSYGSVFSGRVWGIAVDPRNSSVVYVGTDGGGVWNTTNGGTNWTPLTDTQANINIRDLTLAPSAPDTIFAATGGGGILRSTNDGASWTILHPSSGDYVSSVAVQSGNPSVVLAGSCYQVSRSADGGNTWTNTLTVSSQYCGTDPVLFDPANGSIVYAGLGDGLHRSSDGGVTWSLVAGAGLPSGPFSWINLAIAPSSTNILYLALKGTNNLLIGFYRSTNSGASWTQVGVPANDDVPYWGWSLRVHPANPNLIYAGSLLLSMSSDGGNTWAANDTGLHVDHHIQTYSANGSILYVGSDGGIWSTATPTAAGTSWTSLNNSLNTALFYPGISLSPLSPNTAFGGTQDNGILHYQGSLAWSEVACGDGGFTAIDFAQPSNVYAACQNIAVNASTDGGLTFHLAQTGINPQDPVDFIPPLVMDPSNSSRLYFGTYRLYQTLNAAGSWTAISSDLTNNSGEGVATIAVAPSDPNTIYTGADRGVIFTTRNALSGTAATWTARSLPFNQPVTQITVDPQNPLTAWAAVAGSAFGAEGHVYRTADGGATWTSLSSGLPNLTVNDLLLDPDIANTIYAAADVGVYRSVDGGQSWLPMGSAMPNVIAHSLRLDRPSRTLRAATYGRGMWDIAVPVSGQVAITIASSTPGAYFSLEDGTTHQAPVSFYWYTGAQHTVTWLSAGLAGTRGIFSGWSDGVSQNARLITVPASAATYTANITVQYLLSVATSPLQGGIVTLTPSSPDGYYNSGTSVRVSATGNSGYGVWYVSGDISGSLPQSITMSAPHSITVNFYCQYSYNYLPSQLGSGATSGFFQILAGTGCAWNLAPAAGWFTITSPSSGTGPATVAFSVTANSGASRSMALAITGAASYSYSPSIAQDAAATGRPTLVSVQPASGSGITQLFTFQALDPNGASNLRQMAMRFETKAYTNPACDVDVVVSSGSIYVYLLNDSGNAYLGPAQLPGSSTLQNSQCTFDAGHSAISSAGNFVNTTIALTFTSAFLGNVISSAWACDSVSNVCSASEMLGTWSVATGLTIVKQHSGNFVLGQSNASYTVTVSNLASANPTSGTVTVTETVPTGLTLVSMAGLGWTCPPGGTTCTRSDALPPGSSYPAISVTVNVLSNSPSQVMNQVSVSGGGSLPAGAGDLTNITPPPVALRFVKVKPCRVADTRNPSGPLGGPFLAGGATRAFPIPSSACNVPANASAYSLNFTVVPRTGTLGYLSVWPTGQSQPLVSTLNSPDGSVLANAAIVPAGAGGAIDAYATNDTELVIDINGYFVPPAASTLQFYPLAPCRILDTRNPNSALGGPSLVGGANGRAFPVPSSACGAPAGAEAYSFNVTVVPHGTLGYLTAWPTGQQQPVVSTLNSLDGTVLANAAIVPAGTGGAVSFYASDTTDLIVDINGYFAPPATGGLNFYTLPPCRLVDTRNPAGIFGGPILPAATFRTFPLSQASCGPPPNVAAYSLNMTVVPSGPLGYLTTWPAGTSQPVVSTLNAPKGLVVANAALVPTGSGNSVSVYVTNTAQVIIDTNGYFAQ